MFSHTVLYCTLVNFVSLILTGSFRSGTSLLENAAASAVVLGIVNMEYKQCCNRDKVKENELTL